MQKNPEIPHSNIDVQLKLRFEVNADLLEECCRVLIDRHESLRTAWDDRSGTPVRKNLSSAAFRLQRVDLSTERENQKVRLEQEIADINARPIPLDELPIRIRLIQLSSAESILATTLHHIAADGAAFIRLYGELIQLYMARMSGESSPLVSLVPQYSEFVQKQQAFLASEKAERHIAYWRQHLSSQKELPLRGTRPRPETPPTHLSLKPFLMEHPLSEGLQAYCRKQGKSIFTVFASALQRAVQKNTGESEIAIATVLGGREAPEKSSFGYLAGIVIVRTDLSGEPDATEAFRRTNRSIKETFVHSEVPYLYLLEEVLGGDIRRLPSVHFNYIPLDVSQYGPENFPIDLLEDHRTELTWTGLDFYDLGLRIIQTPRDVIVVCRYDNRFLDEKDVERFLSVYFDLLKEFTLCQEP